MVSNIFFDPYLGKCVNLTSIFYKWVVQPQTRKKWWVLNIFCPITEKGCFSFFSNQKNCLSFFSKGLHHFRFLGVKGWTSVALVFPCTCWIFLLPPIRSTHFHIYWILRCSFGLFLTVPIRSTNLIFIYLDDLCGLVIIIHDPTVPSLSGWVFYWLPGIKPCRAGPRKEVVVFLLFFG